MAIHKLKDRQLTTLPAGPGGNAKYYADGHGLALIVRRTPAGSISRSFVFRGTLNGRQLPPMYLDPYPKMSLAAARKERDRCNDLLREGKDPRQERVRAKKDTDKKPKTVNRLLDLYFKRQIEPERETDTGTKRLDRIARVSVHLDHIRKAIGKMLVEDVEPGHLIDREHVGLDDLLKTSAPSAWGLRRVLRDSFKRAVALRWISRDSNPATDEVFDTLLTYKFHKREPRPSLNYVDAPRFVAAVKDYKNRGRGMSDRPLATVPALLFLVYTGVRTQEVREAQWKEIDWENRLWNVPSHHRKAGHLKGKIRAVPISTPMSVVLKEMKRRYPNAADDDLIFPGRSRFGGLARGVINGFIKTSLRWDVNITPHGFRATLKAWADAQRPPYNQIFVERQFDHVVRGIDFSVQGAVLSAPGVAGYDHHDRPNMTDPTIEGDRARREMMEDYGKYLESYKAPKVADTIIPHPAHQEESITP
jgi:integrase